jgi:hypothetical protein
MADDRAAIHDVLVRCCYLIDTRQRSRAAEVFTPDVTFDYGSGPVASTATSNGPDRLSRLEATAHSLSNVLITVSGNSAHALAYVTAHHWLAATARAGPLRPSDFVTIVSYDDDFRREDVGWRICARRLRPLGPAVVASGEVPAGQEFAELMLSIVEASPVVVPAK